MCRYREEEGRELSTWEKKWGRGASRAEKGGQGHGSHERPRATQIQGGHGTEARSPGTAALVGGNGRTETAEGAGSCGWCWSLEKRPSREGRRCPGLEGCFAH